MYNRYVRNDNGKYRRIPVQQEHPHQQQSAQSRENFDTTNSTAGKEGVLSGILGKLRLDELDNGDLLLLVLLFLLFREGEDEELLIALGLLLIL